MLAVLGAWRGDTHRGYFKRPGPEIVMGCDFMGFDVSPRSDRVFITDICGQKVENDEVGLSFV